MNTCLRDGARVPFESADTLNGFDAWRAIIQEIQKSRGIRLAQLRKIVRSQPKIAKVEDVANGILKFENVIREYVRAGGEKPNDKEMKNDLLDTLPQEIRENLMWRTASEEPFGAFRDHVRSAANEILYHRGRLTAPIHNVAEDAAGGNQMEDLVGAIMKKMGFQPKQGGSNPNKVGQGRGERKIKCANCGSEKHTARECDKPRVPDNKRPCSKCGKLGHKANECRSGGSAAGSLEDG